jgi:uncharacterized protein YoxC
MAAEVTREEFEARVGVLDREVEGEKLVTRHILEQARRNADDLAAVKTRLDRVERKVDGVAEDLGSVKQTVEGLVRDLPKIIGDASRSAVRTRRGKA